MGERIAVIDYGSGNLRSVQKAFERAVTDAGSGARIIVTADPDEVARADRIVLPGVGAFAACMAGLEAIDGMVGALEQAVLAQKRPFFGICVGMQLLAESGLEFGETPGLDWIPGKVRRLAPCEPALPVPHTGWNEVTALSPHPALKSLDHRPRDFYFVHSYHFVAENDAHVLGVTDYGGQVVAIIGRDNLLACQFHPEKSQTAGLALIADFLTWRP